MDFYRESGVRVGKNRGPGRNPLVSVDLGGKRTPAGGWCVWYVRPLQSPAGGIGPFAEASFPGNPGRNLHFDFFLPWL